MRTDVMRRALDDMIFIIDDEVIGAVRVKERQSVPPDVFAYTTLAQARDLSIMHERLDALRFDPKSCSDYFSIDGKNPLFELNRVHQLTPSHPPLVWLACSSDRWFALIRALDTIDDNLARNCG